MFVWSGCQRHSAMYLYCIAVVDPSQSSLRVQSGVCWYNMSDKFVDLFEQKVKWCNYFHKYLWHHFGIHQTFLNGANIQSQLISIGGSNKLCLCWAGGYSRLDTSLPCNCDSIHHKNNARNGPSLITVGSPIIIDKLIALSIHWRWMSNVIWCQ